MGQTKRRNANPNSNTPIEETKRSETLGKSVAGHGVVFARKDGMGNRVINMAARQQQHYGDLHTFFTRLGSYNVYNLIPNNKKMAAIIIKYSIILTNLFGVGLWVWWLTIDFEGVKIFVSSVGVFIWGAFKLYEKYLDVKRKRRMDDNEETEHKKSRGK